MLLLALGPLPGCSHGAKNSEAQELGLKETEYSKLKQKALAGDKEAAEKLARLWYQFEYGSSEHAIYWAQVAARNGSKRAGKVLEYAREKVDEDATKVPQ